MTSSSESKGRSGQSKLAGFFAATARVLAVGYLLALLAVVAGLRLIGERWWVTTVALYLPRIGFGLPLPFVVILLLLTGGYRMLLTQVLALWLLLFPLMGLHLSGARAPTPGATRFRLFTANIGLGAGAGLGAVLERIHAVNPDVVVLEEVDADNVAPLRAGLGGYAFQALDQFVIASRFPISAAEVAPEILFEGKGRTARFAHCRLTTPGGAIRLYALHPDSPHRAFEVMRGQGLRNEILSGRVLQSSAREAVKHNVNVRMAQVQAIAEEAAAAADPVIIAGDTNLPGLSWALAHWLGSYQDGFAEAGRGFGYSYPAQKQVWMRIDRVLAGPRFRFLEVFTAPPRLYDHLAVVADVELRPAGP